MSSKLLCIVVKKMSAISRETVTGTNVNAEESGGTIKSVPNALFMFSLGKRTFEDEHKTRKRHLHQGILTEGERPVQFTSLY